MHGLIVARDRLKVFALPIVVGAGFCVAGADVSGQLHPLLLVRAADRAGRDRCFFGYGLMQVSEDLREQRAINKPAERTAGAVRGRRGPGGDGLLGLRPVSRTASTGATDRYRVFGIEQEHGPPSPRAIPHLHPS